VWGGLGVAFGSDGSTDDPTINRNPLTASLFYPSTSIELGYLTEYVGFHGFLDVGKVGGDETSGAFGEIGAGGDVQVSGPLFAVGLRGDAGVAHAAYRCRVCGTQTTFDAVLLEPRVAISVVLGEDNRWRLQVHGGPRWKWIFDEKSGPDGAAASPQVGSNFGLILMRSF
jgi:hypothetical protein